jgi:uncharacterized protein YeaO (DUF488 family)
MSKKADRTMARISIKRAYDAPDAEDGYRVLVDRIWPRGRSRESLQLDLQAPELAPSVALRKWFSHDPERWPEFHERYGEELRAESMQHRMRDLFAAAHGQRITLVYGAKDLEHNHAVILRAASLRLPENSAAS